MARRKDVDWDLPDGTAGNGTTTEQRQLAVLMDIRDELKELNHTLGCYRVQRMSDDINRLDRRLARRYPLRSRKK